MATRAPSTPRQAGPVPLPDPPNAGGAPSAPPTRTAGLLALVRSLIAVGKALIETALRPADSDAQSALSHRFGTFNLALIIARITRGLRLAEALEARLQRNASSLDKAWSSPPAAQPAPMAAATPKPRQPRTPPARTNQQDDDAALLDRMPSAKAIAALVRHRPIGHVLDDICRDLGIDCTHPLWRQIMDAIILTGGSLRRHLDGIRTRVDRVMSLSSAMPPPLPSGPGLAAGTGPP